VNESELRLDFPNGARIQLFGADNPDRLRGLYFDGIIADEYGDWKSTVWPYVIRPALADRKGWAIIIGTPKGKNSFYERFEAGKQDKDCFTLLLTASNSGILEKGVVGGRMATGDGVQLRRGDTGRYLRQRNVRSGAIG
jgi:hypothetical protein